MARPPRELSAEERRLWARVARTVKSNRPLPEPPPPAAAAKRAPAPTAAAPVPRPPPKPRGLATPADRGGEKRVRRGRLEIAGVLDLHGHGQDSARAALRRFVESAPAPCTLIVITGKGRAGEEGVLRRRLPDWLADPAIRPRIAGYAQAHPSHGGGGAFYVFVRAI